MTIHGKTWKFGQKKTLQRFEDKTCNKNPQELEFASGMGFKKYSSIELYWNEKHRLIQSRNLTAGWIWLGKVSCVASLARTHRWRLLLNAAHSSLTCSDLLMRLLTSVASRHSDSEADHRIQNHNGASKQSTIFNATYILTLLGEVQKSSQWFTYIC